MVLIDTRRLQYFRMFILLFLWGICAFFVVWLTIDYFNEGRKSTVDIETYQIDKLRAPWIFTPLFFGSRCIVSLESCSFVTRNSGQGLNATANDCSNAIAIDNTFPFPGTLVNSSKLQEYGFGYTNPMDYMNLSYTIRLSDSKTLVDPNSNIPSVCGSFSSESSTWVAVMADDKVMESLTTGVTVNERDMGSPVAIGLGGIAAISYKLSQNEFLNHTVKNTTEFVSTQFRDLPRNQIEVRVIPQTFGVTKVIQKEGQSFIDLLGSIFGWIGIFTGACIFSVLDSLIIAYQDREKKQQQNTEHLIEDESEMNDLVLIDLRDELRALRKEVDLLKHPAPAMPSAPVSRVLTGISGSRTPPPHRYASQRSVMSI